MKNYKLSYSYENIFKFLYKKEDLYIKILVWAHSKQESGFTWEEMKNKFLLNRLQEQWVRKIFLTTSDSDRKFFEELRNDDSSIPNRHYYSLNEKGMSAAVSYQSLQRAEKSSTWALMFAGVSLFIAAIGIGIQLKQTSLTEIQGMSETIKQEQSIQQALSRCDKLSTTSDSGLYNSSTGNPASCGEILEDNSDNSSVLGRIENLL